MKDDGCLFSVIIPLYNKEKCIARTINSVLSQSYTNFEIVIVDDGSTDNSAAIVKTITDSRIRLFQKENGGVSSARNYGIEKALGKWIFFIDADDILLPSSLEKLYKVFISSESKVDIIAGNYARVTQNTTDIYCSRTYSGLVREKDKYKYFFLNKFAMCPGSTLINKNLLRNIRYNERFCRYEDLDFIGINNYSPFSDYTSKEKPIYEWSNMLGRENNGKGLYWTIRFIHERYSKDKPIMVTENGLCLKDQLEDEKVHDLERIRYLKEYLLNLERAIDEKIPVFGYSYWSFMDNFEWAEGYEPRFGLVYVDYENEKRIFKDSAYYYKDLINSNGAILKDEGYGTK